MERAVLLAADISCDHCIKSIEKAVNRLPGTRFLEGDPAAKKVTVEYDPSVLDRSAIEAAMEEEGYPVTE